MGSGGKWGAAGEAFLLTCLSPPAAQPRGKVLGEGVGIGNPALEDVCRTEEKK